MNILLGNRTLRVDLAKSTVDDQSLALDLRELQPGVFSLLHTTPDGRTASYTCRADGDAVLINGERIPFTVVDPRSLRASSATASATGPRPLKAPMPGRIVRVLVAEGDTVEQGQGCVVMEAMKMQNELKAPRAGTVRKLTATVGDTLAANAVLLVIE